MDQDDELHAIFERHGDFVRTVARRELDKSRQHEVDPDDVLTEVMIVVMRRFRGDPVDNWRGLLTTITQNQVRNIRRRSSKDPRSPLPDDLVLSYSGDDQVTEGLDRERLQRLFAPLPSRLRNLLTLRYLYGMSPGEAAAAAGVSPDKARKLFDELRRKVAVVRGGGRLRGLDARAITDFALGAMALREEETDRA